jgi:hypothetical protein
MFDRIEAWRASVGDETFATVLGAALALYVVNWCRIYRRAGHSFPLGLLMALPGVNLVLMTIFAWGPWPVARQAREIANVRQAVQRADAHTLRRVG